MIIRRLREQDAQAVSELIITTIRISNVGDYPADLMEELVKTQTSEHVLQRASWTHFYVAEEAGAIVGCGAIGPYWGKEDESSLFSIFVYPDHQGKGIGRAIVETLEKDEFALRAKRIEIPASITGLPFYQKMGYSFKDSKTEPDDERLYRLEKHVILRNQQNESILHGVLIMELLLQCGKDFLFRGARCGNTGFFPVFHCANSSGGIGNGAPADCGSGREA